MNKSINLVLNCGYARALAQIGVYDCLVQNSITINSITSVGFGAYTGILIATGLSPEKIIDFFKSIPTENYFQASNTDDGIFDCSKLIQNLANVINYKNIEDLPIKFKVVLYDFINNESVEITKGNIFEVVKKSITYPLIFRLYKDDMKSLVNGKLINPLPLGNLDKKNNTLVIDTESQHHRSINQIVKLPSIWSDNIFPLNPILWLLRRKKVAKLELRVLEMLKTKEIDWILEENNPEFLIRFEQHPLSQTILTDDFKDAQKIISMGKDLGEKMIKNFNFQK